MTTTIWKFPLEITDKQYIEIPHNHEILSVQVQNGQLCLWATVDPASPKVRKQILIFGTGNPVGWHSKFIGTVQMEGGRLVWHVFEGDTAAAERREGE